MAVFSRNDKTSDTVFSGKEITKITKGSEFKGELKVDANLLVEGKIDGNICCSYGVIIEEGGFGQGAVIAKKVTVRGNYNGKIEADLIELLGGCYVTGEIISNKLLVKEGAVFEGISKYRETLLSEKDMVLQIENKKTVVVETEKEEEENLEEAEEIKEVKKPRRRTKSKSEE